MTARREARRRFRHVRAAAGGAVDVEGTGSSLLSEVSPERDSLSSSSVSTSDSEEESRSCSLPLFPSALSASRDVPGCGSACGGAWSASAPAWGAAGGASYWAALRVTARPGAAGCC